MYVKLQKSFSILLTHEGLEAVFKDAPKQSGSELSSNTKRKMNEWEMWEIPYSREWRLLCSDLTYFLVKFTARIGNAVNRLIMLCPCCSCTQASTLLSGEDCWLSSMNMKHRGWRSRAWGPRWFCCRWGGRAWGVERKSETFLQVKASYILCSDNKGFVCMTKAPSLMIKKAELRRDRIELTIWEKTFVNMLARLFRTVLN